MRTEMRQRGMAVLQAFAPCLAMAVSYPLTAQNGPIAIVPVEGVTVTGALDVAEGKATIATSGTVTAGDHTASVTLPRRGSLRLCPTTKVSLSTSAAPFASAPQADAATEPVSSQTVVEAPALMMALDHGAVEATLALGKNSDVILTPDFRILISSPGFAHINVRLGLKGDTCIDNRGEDAPYVTVSSVFEGGVYRVQPEQRVMFQHGSLREVVDREKEPCGCPPEQPASLAANEFPLAQSEGLASLPAPPPNAAPPGVVAGQASVQLSYDGTRPGEIKAQAEAPPAPPASPKEPEHKPGFFTRLGHFFRKLFGG